MRDGIPRHLTELRQLTLLPEADKHLLAMVPLVDAKLAEMEQVLALNQHNNVVAALALVRSGEGKHWMDAIAGEVASVIELEEAALAQRDAAFQADMLRLLVLIVIAGLVAIGAALAFAYATYRASQQRLRNLVYLETERLLELQK